MKRFTAIFLIFFGAFVLAPSAFASTARNITEQPKIDLKYFDEAVYTKKLADDIAASPNGYMRFAGPSSVDKDTRVQGGVLGTVGEAKAADDAYFKISKTTTASSGDEATAFIFELPQSGSSNFTYYNAPNGEKALLCIDLAVDAKTAGTKGIHAGVYRGEGSTALWPALVSMEASQMLFNTTQGMNYNAKQWYTIYLEFDLKNSVYDAYVDGEKKASNVALGGNGLRLLRLPYLGNNAAATIYGDNVGFYPGESFSIERYNLNKDASALSFLRDMLSSNESADKITSNIIMPTVLPNGSTVAWTSSNPAVISSAGAVSSVSDTQVPVTLTAAITNGSKTTTKAFNVTVFDDSLGQAENQLEFSLFSDGQSIDNVTKSLLTLPSAGINNTIITWSSDSPAVLSDGGAVNTNAFSGYEKKVVLTATISKNAASVTKTFEITVKKDTSAFGDIDFINYDLANLLFTDFCAQNPKSVYEDINLPLYKFQNASTFTWSVSDTAYAKIQNYTASFTPKYGEEVSLDLIVTARKGAAEVSKKFPITIARGYPDNIIIKGAAVITASSGTGAYLTAARNTTSYWESLSSDALPTITYSFPSPATFNSALLVERGDNIAAFKLQYSNDGVSWVDFYTGARIGDKEKNLITFSDVTAKYVRFAVTKKIDDNKAASLYSGELFYEAAATTPTPTPEPTKPPELPAIGGGGGGGRTSSGGGAVAYIPPSTESDIPKSEQNQPRNEKFRDVSSEHWAYEYIYSLAEKGIVNGDGGEFNPNGAVTREEFIKMAVLSAGIALSYEGAVFNDVDMAAWYYPYVTAAYKENITRGLGDGSFGVGHPISRQDMAVMAYRLIEKRQNITDGEINYKDNDDIADYAVKAISSLTAAGIMNGGENNEFLPKNNTTRAEAAKIISRLTEIIHNS